MEENEKVVSQPENGEAERLAAELEKLKAQSAAEKEQLEAKIRELEREMLLDEALYAAKVKNAKAVKALLNVQELFDENGELSGLQEQLKALKVSAPYLFDGEQKSHVRVSSAAEHGSSSQQEKTLKEALSAYYAH